MSDEERLAAIRTQRDREINEPQWQKVKHFAWIDMDVALRLLDTARAEIAALTEQRDILTDRLEELVAFAVQRDELRRQNSDKADLLDRCIALFRRNGDYPILTQEIVAALTGAPQAAPEAVTETEGT